MAMPPAPPYTDSFAPTILNNVFRRVSLGKLFSACFAIGLPASLLSRRFLSYYYYDSPAATNFRTTTTNTNHLVLSNDTRTTATTTTANASTYNQTSLPAIDASLNATTVSSGSSRSHRYTPPNYERTPPSRFKDQPLPVQVLEQYQRWHSVESLRQDPHHRKYSIVFYSCPIQAGNRLHHYMNGVVWSILTNRTMLWKYWDTDACDQFNRCTAPYVCREAKNVHDCDAILARAPWIPSYDEWYPRLVFWNNASSSSSTPFPIPFHAVYPKITGRFVQNHCYPWGPGNDETVRGVDVYYENHTVVYFPELVFRNTYLTDPTESRLLLLSNRSRTINRKLHSLGVDFLYGMLFRHSFKLTDAIHAYVPREARHIGAEEEEQPGHPRPYTIALHSRHPDDTLDGCDVSHECSCLRRMMARLRTVPNASSCVVSLMSDRNCTVATLTQWLRHRQKCQVLVANHDTRIDNKQEHGPYAGAGFFQDLALATAARSAFVGYNRSSSYLVLELMTYYRKMEAWQRGVDDLDTVIVDTCLLGNGRVSHPKQKVAASPPN